VKRFRGGLVFKAHRLVYHSTLGSNVIMKKKKASAIEAAASTAMLAPPICTDACTSQLKAQGPSRHPPHHHPPAARKGDIFFFFFSLVTGPRRSLSLKLTGTRVCVSPSASSEKQWLRATNRRRGAPLYSSLIGCSSCIV